MNATEPVWNVPENLGEYLQEKYELPDDSISGYSSDLYILPKDLHQGQDIMTHLTELGIRTHQWAFSDVHGNPWFGKSFIEVPFLR